MAIDFNNPHDLVFRATLSDERRAQAVLNAHVEPWVKEMLADEPPVPLDGSFVDADLRESRSDKLFQVTLASGEPGFVYVLLEHKSTPDPGTALQVLRYKMRIWEAYGKGSGPNLRALQTIIPIVFYHGRAPWTAPDSIRGMLAPRDERLRALEPSFGYFLRDLGRIPVKELAPDPVARAGLAALRYSHRGRYAEKIQLLPEVLAALPDGSEFERQIVVYVMSVWGIRPPTLEMAAEQAKPGRGKVMVGQVIREILEEGRAKGEVRGEAKGEAKERAASLSELLEHHFGRLPRRVRKRIASAGPTELRTWFTTALGADRLAEVFPDVDLG